MKRTKNQNREFIVTRGVFMISVLTLTTATEEGNFDDARLAEEAAENGIPDMENMSESYE